MQSFQVVSPVGFKDVRKPKLLMKCYETRPGGRTHGTAAHRQEESEDVKFYSDAEFLSYTISRVRTLIKSSQYCGLRSIIYLAEDLSSKSIGKYHLVKAPR